MYQKKLGCLSFDPKNSVFSNQTRLWVSNVNFKFHYKIQITIKRLEKSKEKTLYFGSKYIKYSNHKCINFQEAFLTVLRNQHSEIIGIQLEKEREQLELHGDLQNCIPLLMKACISLDFVSNYQIVQLIGSGSTANVYQVRSKIDNKEYAIKVFDKTAFEKDLPLKQSLQMEIRYLKQFNHQNIVKYKGVFESNTQVIIVFELLQGGDLQSNLEGRNITEEHVKQIIRQVLQGLHHMHSLGIFHRDIKKSNIMLKGKGDFSSICLVDFGLADKANDENDYLFRYCGTPGYVAPEILRKSKYGLKVDIYSVGILCYQLLVGRDPYSASTIKETIIKNFLGNIFYSNLPVISPKGLSFLKSILELDPAIRPTAQQALQHPYLLIDQRCNFETIQTNRTIRNDSARERPLFILNSKNVSPSSSPRKIYLKGHLTPRVQHNSPNKTSDSENQRTQQNSLYFKRSFLKMNTK